MQGLSFKKLLGLSTSILAASTSVKAFAAPASAPMSTNNKAPTPSSSSLTNISLKKVTSEARPLGSAVQSGSLYKPNGAVVFVVRRPGCVLCREEAMDLTTQLAPRFASLKKKPKMVAVVSELTSVDPFLEAFKGFDVYLDEEGSFKKALGDRWLGLQGLFYPSVWKNGARAQKKYPELEGDLKGEGRRLGGLLVLDAKGNVKYQHLEAVFGDHAPIEDVFQAVSDL